MFRFSDGFLVQGSQGAGHALFGGPAGLPVLRPGGLFPEDLLSSRVSALTAMSSCPPLRHVIGPTVSDYYQ